jgi:hypothetical protein
MYKLAINICFQADSDPIELEAAPAGQPLAVPSPMHQDELEPAPRDPSPTNNAESAPPSPPAIQGSSTGQAMAAAMEVSSTSQEMLSTDGTLMDATTSDEEMEVAPPPTNIKPEKDPSPISSPEYDILSELEKLEMDPNTKQVVAMWRAGEDWDSKKERMAERERQKAVREAAKAAAAKKEREEEDHGVEEEVKRAFASQDLRGQYGGQGIGLPIVRLTKNY